eukprot:COSAG06_NODE_1159_length_10463_cov_10.703975_4_plen_34_part_00
MATGSRAKVYADMNVHKPREYWDYERELHRMDG